VNANEPDLTAFDALIGTWTTEASHPELDCVVPGRVTFEWLDGGQFVIQRSSHDSDLVPNSISVIGAAENGDGLVMEYFDSRGVRRTYQTSLEGGVWRWSRDVPGFDQRFTAVLARHEFEGHGELARTPGDWRSDLSLRYRRLPDAASEGDTA
jgi:hypothetical protein